MITNFKLHQVTTAFVLLVCRKGQLQTNIAITTVVQ